MSKLIITPSSIDCIKKSIDNIDGIIIGINNFSVNTNLNIDIIDIPKIKEIIKDKELFISIDKNIHNNDLERLKEILIELNNYNINGLLYYDVSIVNLKKKLNLSYDLVWSAEHFTTNYHTINYWNKFKVNYAFLSNDISKDEILDIKENTNVKLMVQLFGHLPMFVSKRHIVKNYLEYFNLKDDSKLNYIYKEEKKYPIVDSDVTRVYSSNILNGILEYLNLSNKGIEYIVLNDFNIDLNEFIKVVEMFKNVNEKNILEYNNTINSMFDCDTGFLYEKTVAKVKRNEK